MTTLDRVIAGLLMVAVIGYLTTFAAWLWHRRNRTLWLSLFVGSWMINAVVFVLNGIACGHPPFGNMYHVQVFLSLCFLPLYILVSTHDGLAELAPHFALASCFPLMGACFMERDIVWRRMPALQSPWFMPHVVAYMISYALAAVAFAVAISVLVKLFWRHWREAGSPAAAWASWRRIDSSRELDPRASYRIMLLAYPFMTFGLLSGALWAEEAWGVYWSWDAKETWSLITWTLYAIYFHCRLRPSLRRHAIMAQLLAFVALIITFLVVNLLPKLGSVLHSYA